METKIQPSDIQIVFECDMCGSKETCDVFEAVYNGAPMCSQHDDHGEMAMLHCSIKKHFKEKENET